MPDRRLVLAILAASLLLAGAILTPWTRPAAEGALLGSSVTMGSVARAIDSGTAGVLAGYLPGSEGYQRVHEVTDGLKEGAPERPLTQAQLDDVTAIARGTALGVVSQSPNTLTSAEDRAALRAIARGIGAGALDELALAPTSARRSLDEAVAKGILAGAISQLIVAEPTLSTSSHEAYARWLIEGVFSEIAADAQLASTALGSPALADVTLFTSDIIRAQLASIPLGVLDLQLQAIATFAAGGIDGMISGLVTSFPNGLPAPARADIHSYLDAIARGHEGTAPWQSPAALPVLQAWAAGIVEAAFAAERGARDTIGDRLTPGGTLREIDAYVGGLAGGGYDHLHALLLASPEATRDIGLYAQAIAQPLIERALVEPHPTVDPAALEAWARGLSGALDDLTTGFGEGKAYLDEYVGTLSAAALSLPASVAPQHVAILSAFLEGVTTALDARLAGIARAAGVDDAPMITAMATGLAEGALGILSGPTLRDPSVAAPLGDGLASGFLASKDIEAIFDDVDAMQLAVEAWFEHAPPVAVGALAASAVKDALARERAARSFGANIGEAPVAWAALTGQGLTEQSWGGVDDALWLAGFAQASGAALMDAGLLVVPEDAEGALLAYADALYAALPQLSPDSPPSDVGSGALTRSGERFAAYAMAPLAWIGGSPAPEDLPAALAFLEATLDNAGAVERFSEASYAQAATAFAAAMAKGVEDGSALVQREGADPDPAQGVLVPAWVEGVTTAILTIDTEADLADLTGRISWLSAATSAVVPVASQATADQIAATAAFATRAAAYATGAAEHVPDAGGFDAPLVAWAHASIGAALAALPSALTPEEEAAITAYLMGITTAVTSLPPSDIEHWSAYDIDAMVAYVGGISGGVDGVAADTHLYLCSLETKSILADCPVEEEPPGGCEGSCPPPSGGSDPETPEECETECALDRWYTNVEAWANALTVGGLEQIGVTEPTEAGVALVAAWAYEVLGAHGICPDTAPAVACDGPRGPPGLFGGAPVDAVQAFATAVSDGYGPFVENTLPRDGAVDAIQRPLLAWAGGLEAAIGEFILAVPGGSGGQGSTASTQSVSDVRNWSIAMWDAIPDAVASLGEGELVDEDAVDQLGDAYDRLFAYVISGGGSAALASARAAQDASVATDGRALYGLAFGLIASTRTHLVDPASADVDVVANWYYGLAEGGVTAVVAAGDMISQDQVPAIAAYAEFLGTSLTPPPPPIDKLPGAALLAGGDDEDDDDGGGNSTGGSGSGSGGGNSSSNQTSPQQTYLKNVQAHAAGLASALSALPLDAFAPGAGALRDAHAAYLEAIVQAALAVPPISPDAGFPARLSAWVQAESDGALSTSLPIEEGRIGPAPDSPFIKSYINAFAGTSPWNLPPAIEGRTSWAKSAILAGASVACPRSDAECRKLGNALGGALGRELPAAPAGIPEGDQLALIQAFMQGVSEGLPEPLPPGIGALADGILAGLLTMGVGDANSAAATAAAADALAPAMPYMPKVDLVPTAEYMVQVLLTLDSTRYQSFAAAFVEDVLDIGDDATREQIAALAAAESSTRAKPSVRVTDGLRDLGRTSLDGPSVLDGAGGVTFTVRPPANAAGDSTWSLRWSQGDTIPANTPIFAMTAQDGIYSKHVNFTKGGPIRFVIIERSPVGETVHDRDGSPFGFIADVAPPTAVIVSVRPATSSLTVSWNGQDAETPVAGYQVEARTGDAGAWRTWLTDTMLTEASFAGVAGTTYAFRVRAVDAVGHASEPSASVTGTLPPTAPLNRAPTLAFTSPLEDDVFRRSVPVGLTAADPDGTTPTVQICVRRIDVARDIVCPYEGHAADTQLDLGALPDGTYILRATANDGTLKAESASPAFHIDREPPAFIGAGADATPTRVVITASLDAQAARVLVDIAGVGPLVLRDDGRGVDLRPGDGLWSALTTLPPGEHVLTFRAGDAVGNEAAITKRIVVPAPTAKPGDPPAPVLVDERGTVAPGDAVNEPGEEEGRRTPGFGLVGAILGLALIALARRRRFA